MSGMNSWLASIYGTDGADDLEKTAQAHMLQKLAAEQNLDISQLSPEEIEQLVQELAAEGYDVGALMQPQVNAQNPQTLPSGTDLNPTQPGAQSQGRPQAFAPAAQSGQPQAPQGFNPQLMQNTQQPQAQSMEAMQKEAQAKFEEADLLGRVMAHAYTDELEKIATHRKTAGRFGAAKDAVKGAFGRAKDAVKANPKKAVGAAAAMGAGAYLAGKARKGMNKEASAFEKLAEEHAAEILSATGYDPATGQDLYGQQMLQQSTAQSAQQPQQAQNDAVDPQPSAPQNEQFVEALDNRALELLAQHGYDVNEILARIQMAQNQAPQGQA